VTRRGVNKRQADTEDLLSLYAITDVKKIAPKCAELNLARLPPAPSPSNTGSCLITAVNDTVVLLQSSVGEIQQQMVKVVAKLDELKAGQPEIRTVVSTLLSPSGETYNRTGGIHGRPRSCLHTTARLP